MKEQNDVRMKKMTYIYEILRRTFTKYAFGSFEKIRLALYLLMAILAITILPLHFLGLVGISDPSLMATTASVLVGCIVCLVLYLTHRLHLVTAFSATGIAITLLENLGIIYMVVRNVPGLNQGIALNILALGLLYILLCMALLYKTAFWAGVTNLLVMIVSIAMKPGLMEIQFMLVFALLSFAFGIYAFFTSDVIRRTQRQSNKYRHRLDQIFEMFQMTSEEMVALVRVCRQNQTDKDIDKALLSKLTFRSKANLIKLAEKLKAEKLNEANKYAERFPQLTPTEIDVCRLVVKGLSLKEIAQNLGKSISNVSTVRGNIRRKLKLESSENLRAHLITSLKDSHDHPSQLAVF